MVQVSPRWRARSRVNSLICHIDVTAFLAVMLALLYIFMPVKTDTHPYIPVDMAKVSNPRSMRAADREDALTVAVTRDGTVYFRTSKVPVDELPALIHGGIAQGAESRIYIRADGRAKYADVKAVLDSVRGSGVEQIAFLVDQRRPTPTPQ